VSQPQRCRSDNEMKCARPPSATQYRHEGTPPRRAPHEFRRPPASQAILHRAEELLDEISTALVRPWCIVLQPVRPEPRPGSDAVSTYDANRSRAAISGLSGY